MCLARNNQLIHNRGNQRTSYNDKSGPNKTHSLKNCRVVNICGESWQLLTKMYVVALLSGTTTIYSTYSSVQTMKSI